MLYRTLASHWADFWERAEEAGELPRLVQREVDEYLRCGLLEHGCVRVGCKRCGYERLVACDFVPTSFAGWCTPSDLPGLRPASWTPSTRFSCKRRGFCPSCLGRRMSDTAVHLVEKVIPEVPVRQWACSLPWRLRVLVGYDRRLCADVLEAFVVELSREGAPGSDAPPGQITVQIPWTLERSRPQYVRPSMEKSHAATGFLYRRSERWSSDEYFITDWLRRAWIPAGYYRVCRQYHLRDVH